MPRNIPAEALAQIAQRTGLEPVNIVSVQWVPGAGYVSYCDRNVEGLVQGKLLEIADLEAVLDISKSTPTTSVNIVLDDTDSTIKQIFDSVDIINRHVIIYQWFTNLSLAYKFQIFEGVIASPVSWNEADRTFSFDVISKIKEVYVGFTVEDGDFQNVPIQILNKAWPLIFGEVLDVPCLQMDQIPSGMTEVPIGIKDPTLTHQINYQQSQATMQGAKAACISLRGAELQMLAQENRNAGLDWTDLYSRGKQMEIQARDMMNQINNQIVPETDRFKQVLTSMGFWEPATIPILNGKFFLQGQTVSIKINDATFIGTFNGNMFSVQGHKGPNENFFTAPDGTHLSTPLEVESVQQKTQAEFDKEIAAKLSAGSSANNFGFSTNVETIDMTPEQESAAYWSCSPPYAPIVPWNISQANQGDTVGMQNKQDFWFAQAGASVKPGTNYPIRYIISITPGTQVLWLSSKSSVLGSAAKILTPIPPQYYVLGTLNFGPVTALIATFLFPLSALDGQDWENDVYATVRSSIGPNVVNILIWAIQNYTNYKIDHESFNHVRNIQDAYPANFALLEKKDIFTFLKEVAWQARCAIWLSNDIFYIKYLPEQGNSIDTITEDDVETQTLQVTASTTEELVTRFVATYKESYAATAPNEIVLKYNIGKYGLIERTFDFYIYNISSLVLKSATFWLIRMSSTWKILKCKTFLNKLTLETLDNVTIDFTHPFVATVPVVGQVQKATFNSKDFAIEMEIWLPVHLGTMVPNKFAYPAHISVSEFFPEIQETPGIFVQLPTSGASGNLGASSGNNIGSISPQIAGFGSDGATTNPSDLSDLPPISGAGSNLPYITGGGGGASSGAPAFDYQYRPIMPLAPTTAQPSTVPKVMPGLVVGQSGDNAYIIDAYPNGFDKPSIQVLAIVVGLNADDILPGGAPGAVIQTTFSENRQTFVVNYFILSAIWSAPPPE